MARTFFCASFAGLVSAAFVGAASAGFTADDLNITVASEGGFSWSSQNNPSSVNVEQVGENEYRVTGGWTGASWEGSWDMTVFTAGPATRGGGSSMEFVISNFAFTNNTGATNNFILGVTASTGAMSAPTGISGSVSGTVLSGLPSVNTATMSTFGGNSIYNAKMDGSIVRTLLDDPFSASTMFTTNFGTADFGIPIPEVGPGLVSSIGIDHMFRLTNGDGVTFSSAFVVVPTPGAAGLLAMGGLLAFRRRR